MKKSILILLAFSFFNSKAQSNNTLKEKKSLFNGAEITYHLNQEDQKAGAYFVKDKKSDNFLIKGQYLNNERIGNWYFYGSNNNLNILYNYSQKKLLFLDSTFVSSTVISILSNDESIKNNASVPILLYPKDLFIKTALNSLDISSINSNEVKLDITIDIFDANKIEYSISYFNDKNQIIKPINLDKNSISIDWIPAMYDSKPVRSQIIMRAHLILDQSEGIKRFRWDN